MTDQETLFDFLSYPLGDSDSLLKRFAALPGAIHRGSGFRQFVFIEGSRENRIVLVAHADTVWPWGEYRTQKPDLQLKDGIITNRNGGLGADDRAGCAIVWLLRNSGHSILITDGEEFGLQGSSFLMAENPDIADEINLTHKFCVQFDRRNSRDFKCYSVGTDEFRAYIAAETGYQEPDRHSCTDIVELCRDICGVNFSIGYYKEHTDREYLVLDEWQSTLRTCKKWLTRKKLPRFTL